MPKAEAVFNVKVPIQELWNFLSDMKNVGSCIPGCEVNLVDSCTSDWRIRAKLGFLSKTIELRTRTTERIAPRRAAWTGEGDDIKMTGSLDLKPVSAEETETRFNLSIDATGSIGAIINNAIAGKIDEYRNGFADCVKSKLEYPETVDT